MYIAACRPLRFCGLRYSQSVTIGPNSFKTLLLGTALSAIPLPATAATLAHVAPFRKSRLSSRMFILSKVWNYFLTQAWAGSIDEMRPRPCEPAIVQR